MTALARRVGALSGGAALLLAAGCGAAMALGAAAGLLAASRSSWRCRRCSGCSTAPPGRAAPSASAGRRGRAISAPALFWIVEPFLVQPEVHGWMAPFALVGLAGGHGAVLGAALRAGAGAPGRAGPARVADAREPLDAGGVRPRARADRLPLGADRLRLGRDAGDPGGGARRAARARLPDAGRGAAAGARARRAALARRRRWSPPAGASAPGGWPQPVAGAARAAAWCGWCSRTRRRR